MGFYAQTPVATWRKTRVLQVLESNYLFCLKSVPLFDGREVTRKRFDKTGSSIQC